MKVWILTEEYNDYDQHGEYFLKVFKDKPTHQNLATALGYTKHGSQDFMQALALVEHVLSGGGRRNQENHWYNLEEVETV